MKKVLIVNTVGFEYDGITSVIRNYTKEMDREGLQFVFPVYERIDPTLKGELEQLGTTVVVPDRKKNTIGYMNKLYRYLKGQFDVVHIHGNSGTMLIEVLLAKFCGVKTVIVHSHSTKTDHPLVNRILKVPMMWLVDNCIACSKASGDWLYGDHPYTVLNNAIDLPKFRFSEEARVRYREGFGVREEFLIGHIGHFSPSKNHSFLIDIFCSFHKSVPDSKLLLIGDGPYCEQVNAKVRELGLQDAVIFAGRRSDIAGIYSAMDLFLFPSRWEGFGMVLVEAQAAGLFCLASDAVPRGTKMTDAVSFVSLEESPDMWAEYISRTPRPDRQTVSEQATEKIDARGYNIKTETEKLRMIYLRG